MVANGGAERRGNEDESVAVFAMASVRAHLLVDGTPAAAAASKSRATRRSLRRRNNECFFEVLLTDEFRRYFWQCG